MKKSPFLKILFHDPVKYTVLSMGIDECVSSLRSMNEWLEMDELERLIRSEDYSEFDYMGEDEVFEFVLEIKSILN